MVFKFPIFFIILIPLMCVVHTTAMNSLVLYIHIYYTDTYHTLMHISTDLHVIFFFVRRSWFHYLLFAYISFIIHSRVSL